VSAYKIIATQMTRTDVLVAALEQVKPKWKGHIKSDETGSIPLYGYQGDDRTKKNKSDKNYAPPCTVMIPGEGSSRAGRGKNVVGGASNDIGFSRKADGTFVIHVSDYDRHKYGKDWENKIKMEYGLVEKVDTAVKAGAQIGQRQTFNHPKWGQVEGVRCRIRAGQLT